MYEVHVRSFHERQSGRRECCAAASDGALAVHSGVATPDAMNKARLRPMTTGIPMFSAVFRGD